MFWCFTAIAWLASPALWRLQFVVHGLHTYFSLMGPVPGEIDAVINCSDQVCKTSSLQDFGHSQNGFYLRNSQKVWLFIVKTFL